VANTYDYSGRVALITGGASGIGAATAARLAAGGARVALLDRSAEAVEASARDLGGEALALIADVTRSDEVNEAVARVERELGRLDVLVCSAGISGRSLSTVDVDDEEWERVLAVNLTGTFWCNRAVVPGMVARGYGRIVNVASMAGKEGNPMAAAYSAAKAGVIGVTKAIGKDVAKTGVLVNCVAPAPVETPMLGDITQEHIDYMLARVPMGRLATADEAATLIAFLASEDLSFSTGATFDLSGGRAVY
jgi:NAD(P)-dependent dehydrogenase (short-subunit alcohol dehydrogenase family)